MKKYQIKQIIPITNPLFAVFMVQQPDKSYTRSCRACHCLALIDHEDGEQAIEGVIFSKDGLYPANEDDCFQGYVENPTQAAAEFPFPA